MPNSQQRAAKLFAERWKDKGYEKGQSQPFWITLLTDVFGVSNVAEFIEFEDQVHIDHTSFIDGYIPSTKVLIEQKSLGKDLNAPIRQSNGTYKTPIQQAIDYIVGLPLSRHPRWVITCNFAEFYLYDMEHPQAEPQIIKLSDLENEYYRLSILVDATNEHIQREMDICYKAGDIVGMLYDAFLAQYPDPTNPETLKSLNKLCVRLVFCLYAEDAGLFGSRLMFHDYLAQFSTREMRSRLEKLFVVLNQKPEERYRYLRQDDPELAEFPYVNGGLFADEIDIPPFTDEIRDLLLSKASSDFDWSEISPTIFGAMFESTLNPETRRSGGMHYTAIEKIHKVIDPLFLDELNTEYAQIQRISVLRTRNQKLKVFQEKLGSLKFLDPAAGSGNFLTETYLSLRRLENKIIAELSGNSIALAWENATPIKVSISQFYGIEINDFAATVAKTALWIAESQMMKQTETILNMDMDFLPLKSNANIWERNALDLDWEEVVSKYELDYIMGNPPFYGARKMTPSQKNDLKRVFDGKKGYANLDYVSGWYVKAADYMKGTRIKAALVSTNSITQGEQAPLLWKELFSKGLSIIFAHRTFQWDSEATIKAHVHCVIIGFSYVRPLNCQLYEGNTCETVGNINAYLVNAPNILVESRRKPICNVPSVVFGSMPNDNGFLSDYSEEKVSRIIHEYPIARSMFRPFLGATEFLNGKKRWCLWLKDISPNEIRQVRPVMEAIRAVKELRESSDRAETKQLALTPSLFGEIRQPDSEYIIIPRHSSENREYIPIGFVAPNIICGDSNLLLPNASLYIFGVLVSSVHNHWMRAVCGRLEMRYRYSASVVYNNFPWPKPTQIQRERIEATARQILEARALYPDCSLADLYDKATMPPELSFAHKRNDQAVLAAYGFSRNMDERTCVSELMKMYQALTDH